MLRRQSWPGNVRELENFVQGLMVLVGEGWVSEQAVAERLRARELIGTLDSPAPPAEVRGAPWTDFPDGGVDLNARLAEYETELIKEALRRAGGNKTRAAKLLGLNRTTLVEKLKRKGL